MLAIGGMFHVKCCHDAVAADSKGQSGQFLTLEKKMGETIFLPTYLPEEALLHPIPHQTNCVQQDIFSGGVTIVNGWQTATPALNEGRQCHPLYDNASVKYLDLRSNFDLTFQCH